MEHLLTGLTAILLLGVAASWLAWRLRLPSILLLLLFGFLAGPVTGLIDPNEILGDLLLPIVSLSVAVILFEGGLNLNIDDLRKVGKVVRRLITIGMLVTWSITSAAAYFLLDMSFDIALLMGAILVVTGPTVIIPLLRSLHLGGKIGSILRWEGIVIDPIGVILAVLVFEAISAGGFPDATSVVISDLLITIIAGSLIGVVSALIVAQILRSYWLPDFLHSAFTLAFAIGAFTAANSIQTDSGLLSVTVMGIFLANQKWVSVRHIIEFKENLRVLLISVLFIILAASLDLELIKDALGVGILLFLLVLILIARPLSVALSTVGSGLKTEEKGFLASIAPRGIVAASVASVFALRLAESGRSDAEMLVPYTFIVIAATVALYGLAAAPLAKRLKIGKPNPQGVLFVGSHNWARAIAVTLLKEGFSVMMVDSNRANIQMSRMAGLAAFHSNILTQYARDEINLHGLGHFCAITSDDDYNSLAIMQFVDAFQRSSVYQLPPRKEENDEKEVVSEHLRGRILFGPGITYAFLSSRFTAGATVKITGLTDEFNYQTFNSFYDDKAVPLFLIDQRQNLIPFTTEGAPEPQAGQKIVSLVNPESK